MANAPRETNRGYTIVEMIIVLVIGSLILSAVYEIMISQSWSFGRQREISDVQNSLRAAGNLLTLEIRSADPRDIYVAADTAFGLRTYTASGVVCTEDVSGLRLSVAESSGGFMASSADSVLILAQGDPGVGDDVWRTFGVAQVGAGVGATTCTWPDTSSDQINLTPSTPNDTTGIRVGAPLLAFHRVDYALHSADGRWWLARRIGNATSWDLLTGPLLSPDEGGLEFRYATASGTPATTPQDIAVVTLVIRAESFAAAGSARGPQHVRDSLAMRIRLRNAS